MKPRTHYHSILSSRTTPTFLSCSFGFRLCCPGASLGPCSFFFVFSKDAVNHGSLPHEGRRSDGNGRQRGWCNKNKHGTSEQEMKGRIQSAKTKQAADDKLRKIRQTGGKKKEREVFSQASDSASRIKQLGLACAAPTHAKRRQIGEKQTRSNIVDQRYSPPGTTSCRPRRCSCWWKAPSCPCTGRTQNPPPAWQPLGSAQCWAWQRLLQRRLVAVLGCLRRRSWCFWALPRRQASARVASRRTGTPHRRPAENGHRRIQPQACCRCCLWRPPPSSGPAQPSRCGRGRSRRA